MEKLIDINAYPVSVCLKKLLKDKTTGGNIIWATDAYSAEGTGFADTDEMKEYAIRSREDLIKPRIDKSDDEKQKRTRKKAEVFTPVWLCNQMNNFCDEEWFGRKGVFNVLHDDHTWDVVEGKVEFPEDKSWQEEYHQMSLFEMVDQPDEKKEDKEERIALPCKIRYWRYKKPKTIVFKDLKEK